jgi:hypothetical protein
LAPRNRRESKNVPKPSVTPAQRTAAVVRSSIVIIFFNLPDKKYQEDYD